MKVSIGIKAFNEEKHIARAIKSALAAVRFTDGEVVLADSGSHDRTIAIAEQFGSHHPLRVVQLVNQEERCCGAGAQLAYQHARGKYFYILDGDMVLHADFLPAAIAYLDAHPHVAGVGGIVREMDTTATEFQIRAQSTQQRKNWQAGLVDRLDCGGLYRREAIAQVGWFADRNLHAFEEYELAARLQAKGWKLARIDTPAVDHYGHAVNGYALLLRRIRSGYSGAAGEVLRAAWGQPHFGHVVKSFGHLRTGIAVIIWWLALLASTIGKTWLLLSVLSILPVLFLSWRRGTLSLGLYSLTAWNVSALGLIIGFFRRRKDPAIPLRSVILAEPPIHHNSTRTSGQAPSCKP